jgi:spore coat polysaccharide biosynthesis predicted glycosyltransferase SpsG
MDRNVFIYKMLTYLQSRFSDFRFHVITANPCHPTLQYPKKTKYYSAITAQRMKAVMLCCDMAISGGGQTTNELAACGLPAVGICFAKNQRPNIQGWKQHGFLNYAGLFNDPEVFKNIEKALRRLSFQQRRKMKKIGQRLMDGRGADRVGAVIAKMENMCHV